MVNQFGRCFSCLAAAIFLSGLGQGVSAQADLLLHTGANISRLTPHAFDPAEYSTVRGFVAGVGVSTPLYGPLSLRADVEYTEKGARLGGFSRIDLKYLEVPVLIEYSPKAAAPVQPLVTLGVAAAREIDCGGRTGSWEGRPVPLDCDDFRSATTDMAWVAGVGAKVPLRNVYLTAELRYTKGSQDLTGYRNQNRTTSIIVGLRTR